MSGAVRVLRIARDVTLDLSTEYSDTRLPPGQTAIFDYARPLSPDAVLLVMKIHVAPDAFYSRFFQALLESDLGEQSRMLIAQALGESNASMFSLFEERSEIAPLAPSQEHGSWRSGAGFTEVNLFEQPVSPRPCRSEVGDPVHDRFN